jgi:hypothetical protein
MLRSWWWCCVASAGPWLGRHSHSLALLGLTPGAGASRFGAALVGLLSPLACSLPIYLAVYYLCRLKISRSSSCPSPATNRYVRLFPSPPALRNLGSGGGGDEGLWFAAYDTRAFIKILCGKRRQSIKNLEIFLVDNLRGYCCELSQHTGNRLVYINGEGHFTLSPRPCVIARSRIFLHHTHISNSFGW